MKFNITLPSPADLRYFEEIASTGSLSRAAERLNIGQPALSLALKRLEGALETRLFLRRSRGLELTPAGVQLLRRCRSLYDEWERIQFDIRNVKDEARGFFRLGCHSAVGIFALNPFVRDVYSLTPGIQFRLVHGLSRVMTEQVVSGTLDFAFVINPLPHPDLVIRKLATDEVAFWASPKALGDVLIADPELAQSQVLSKKAAARFKRYLHSGSLEVIAALARSGAGVAILPSRVVRGLAPELRRLEDLPVFRDEIAFVYRSDLPKTAAVEAVLAAVRKLRL